MSKGEQLLSRYQWLVLATLILFVGFVIFNAFTGELSKYTAEQLANMTLIGGP